jgi:hypothetical protein
MNKIKVIEVTHANLHTKVVVAVDLLFSWYYSPTHKSTMLVSTAGGLIPCLESPDEITTKLQTAGL